MNARRRPLLGLALLVALVGCSSGSGTVDTALTTPAGTSAATRTTSPATSAPVESGPATTPPEPFPEVMAGARYRFGPFGEKQTMIDAKGPDGWIGIDPSWGMDGPEPVRAEAPDGIGIVFFTPNGLYSDPCHWDVSGTGDAGAPGDVSVGSSVDDMVAALRDNTFYTSTVPKPVTIDGYAGKELEIQLPDRSYAKCDKDDPNDSGGHEFVFSGPGLYAQGPGNRWHLYILDVDGARLVSVILSYAKTSKSHLDTARNVIETMDINPT
jgi:hypothetical protein